MSDDDRIIPKGPFKGKKLEFAATEVVDLFCSLADDEPNRAVPADAATCTNTCTGKSGRSEQQRRADAWKAAPLTLSVSHQTR
jgi:hypothetical protein